MADSYPLRDWHQVAVELLMSDADLALLSIAWVSRREAVAHVVERARDSYQSIQNKREELSLSDAEEATLGDKLDRLRARLQVLDQAV